jgi:hypothetical protein
MQLCREKVLGKMSAILHPDDLATPSVFFDATWISHTVKAGTRSGSELCFVFMSITRLSSSQKLSVFPLWSSDVYSSRRGPFSMLLDAFSNE